MTVRFLSGKKEGAWRRFIRGAVCGAGKQKAHPTDQMSF